MSKRVAAHLQEVRSLMAQAGVDYYLVPSSDDHQNEYVPERWQRRAFISGFDGSAGDVLIGRDQAWLWTDSRYHLQAEQQLAPDAFELMRLGEKGIPPLSSWLRENAGKATVGVDPKVVSLANARKLEAALQACGGELRAIEGNWIDQVWTEAPDLSDEPATRLDDRFSGRSVTDKLSSIRKELAGAECDSLLVTTLDAIAWTLNLRGRDISYNPLVISYLWIGSEAVELFVDPDKLDADTAEQLSEAGIRCRAYVDFGAAVEALAGRVWLDPSKASWWVSQRLEAASASAHEAAGPIELMKAVKNRVELDGMRTAHERDAVALVRFFHWLESAFQSERDKGLDEFSAAEQLEAFRSEGAHFQGLSFPTISGFAGNGAIVHYGVDSESAAKIDDRSLYLVDSGAQYLDGTTDVTRTLHLGTPTPEERRHYTLVLKGHLALRHARFPTGTTGGQLDVLARKALWDEGLDYGHGTGHGVGHYLNVHEGPHSISTRCTGVALMPGMVVSNEPGLYLRDRYGIRIENLVYVLAADDAEPSGGPVFLRFDDLTLVPYARKLIASEELSADELVQVNAYQRRVYDALADHLESPVRAWLERETAALP